MPTGKDSLNPGGLMEAARRASGPRGAVEKLLSQLASSEEFAARFDEAVMREDKDTILGLIAEAGARDDIKVTIENLDGDRQIGIQYCWAGDWGHVCLGLYIVY